MTIMPSSWNDVRSRAIEFSKRWAGETSGNIESRSFWRDFFDIFGVDCRWISSFEEHATRLGIQHDRFDLFWRGTLLVERKLRGKSLDKAYSQDVGCFPGVKERDRQKHVLVSDFARFRLYNIEDNTHHEFSLNELHNNIKHFTFIVGYRTGIITPQNPASVKAVERMGKLHDGLRASRYIGHPLELLLIRLLFCLFAEDTGIFQPAGAFRLWIEEQTADDGSDLGLQLARLFRTLDSPEGERPENLDVQLAAFPYANGTLFQEILPIADFDATMREDLLNCCALDWSTISPAVFGEIFQSIMDPRARRIRGVHYTSEENILKLIKPLFLDELWAEFELVRSDSSKLFDFHNKLNTLTFLDPACGCGNFLVIAYREMRLLELDVLRALREVACSRFIYIRSEINVDLVQFNGIEIDELPAQIAQVALWLVYHQMNVLVSTELGMYFSRVPVKTTPNIVRGNALTLDWNEVLPVNRATYVFGNPPFVGAKFMNNVQREETQRVLAGINSSGLLDYVAAWYVKAVHYLSSVPSPPPLHVARIDGLGGDQAPSRARCAFVSTNSITQGEQVGVLWGWLLAQGVRIHFAHRSFRWSNEAKGVAAVHCVVIGFGLQDIPQKLIFQYEDNRSEPRAIVASHINPYLVDAPSRVILRRSHPICNVPEIGIGNKPIDGGNYLFTDEEKAAFLAMEPTAKPFFRRWVGANELINGFSRWCLWLGDAKPHELRTMPECLRRIEAVRRYRLDSKSAPTRKLAQTPTRFHVECMPQGDYLVIAKVSSSRRDFIPIGFEKHGTLCSDLVFVAPKATLLHFAILNSTMHNAWTRAVCGRLGSGYRYSASIVYNNYPWPDCTNEQFAAIETGGQGILDARALHDQSSLADLYDSISMPTELRKAHADNDRVVDAAYGYKGNNSDVARVAFLFELYNKLTSLLPPEKPSPC